MTAAPPKPLACVMGDLDLLRPLAMTGVRCAVFGPSDDPIHFSRYAVEDLGWIDHWSCQPQVVERLLAFGRSQPEPPPLFFQTDGDLMVVSRYRQRLGEAFRFAIAEADLVEALVDKARFQDLADRLELPVPRTLRVRADRAAPDDVDLAYPLVIKPLTRDWNVWSRVAQEDAKAVHVQTPDELGSLWPRLQEGELEVMAQEAVPGPETLIESYHAYVDAEGATAGEFTGRKLRTHPERYGHSSAVTITDEADVARAGRDVLARLGLRGVAKVDFKRTPEGSLRLLEINPRFNLWHHPAAVAGVNLPALVYADLTGRPRPAVLPVRAGVYWSDLRRDLPAVGRGPGALLRWLGWFARAPAKWALSWRDPMPILRGLVWRHLRRRFSR